MKAGLKTCMAMAMATEDGRDPSVRRAGKLTPAVIWICIVAASAGLMFGYDIGISGGVTTIEPFLKKFYPSVLAKMGNAKQDKYCTFDSHILTFFTSSLYLAALVTSLSAGPVTAILGRQGTLLLSGILFAIGAALDAFAINIEMLIFGRIFLGFAVGFANQAAPVYLTEMAPPRWRGTLNNGFQFFLAGGSVLATFMNFAAGFYKNDSWRVALGGAMIPAVIMTFGSLFIPDTPSSLVQRGKHDEARQALLRVRGADSDIDAELTDLINSNNDANVNEKKSFKKLFLRQYRPQVTITLVIQLCQQLTGVNMVAFYAPVLFRSMGSGQIMALTGAIILGVVNLAAAVVSACTVDKLGRRFLFIQGGVQIMLSHIAIAGVLAIEVHGAALTKQSAGYVLFFMCCISAAFGWSWGPLNWLLPSEILPTEIRPAGLGLGLAINFLITFVQAQIAMTLLCHLKVGLFILYAVITLAMTVFIVVFVPETKGVPLESMDQLWESHWYWRRFVSVNPTADT